MLSHSLQQQWKRCKDQASNRYGSLHTAQPWARSPFALKPSAFPFTLETKTKCVCHCSVLTSFHIYNSPPTTKSHCVAQVGLKLQRPSYLSLTSNWAYRHVTPCPAPPFPSSDSFCMCFCCLKCFLFNMAAIFVPFRDVLKGSTWRYVYSLLFNPSFSPPHISCVLTTIQNYRVCNTLLEVASGSLTGYANC